VRKRQSDCDDWQSAPSSHGVCGQQCEGTGCDQDVEARQGQHREEELVVAVLVDNERHLLGADEQSHCECVQATPRCGVTRDALHYAQLVQSVGQCLGRPLAQDGHSEQHAAHRRERVRDRQCEDENGSQHRQRPVHDMGLIHQDANEVLGPVLHISLLLVDEAD